MWHCIVLVGPYLVTIEFDFVGQKIGKSGPFKTVRELSPITSIRRPSVFWSLSGLLSDLGFEDNEKF